MPVEIGIGDGYGLGFEFVPCKKFARNDLPRHLHDGLENGTYGRDYLKNIDGDLSLSYPFANITHPPR